MPGFYPADEYDLAGFSVGMADYDKIVDSKNIKAGDVLVGIASSGVHSNGFSLVRKVFDVNEENVGKYISELGMTLGESLLTPTKIYAKQLGKLLDIVPVNGISHITGGGFYENIPRMLGDNQQAVIKRENIPVLPIFDIISKIGHISEHDMFNTFNMGVGIVMAVSPDKADEAVRIIKSTGENAFILGEVTDGEDGVIIE